MLKFFDIDLSKFISPRAYEEIYQKFTIVEIQESLIILFPGEYQKHLYLIKSGVVRCYYKAFENEWTNWFAAEGNSIFSIESFWNNQPSLEYIETCTPVILYQISKQDYDQLLIDFPELHKFSFQLIRSYLIKAEKRMYGLHMLNAYQLI